MSNGVELATAFVNIALSAQGIKAEIERELGAPLQDAAKKAGDKASMSLQEVGKEFTRFGVGALAAAGIVGVGLLKTGEAASNLNESINAVQVTFGDAAGGILKLGENAATAMGLSNTAFNSLAVQFSAFATTIAGRGGDVVATMKDLTGRAADFASVMNIDVAEAATLFQSGLAGETEPLRRYGLDLSAAAVQNFALANGIGETGRQLTEAEKVQARYGLLMESTSKTQGDFANTSDSAANATRIAKAEMENAAASLGTALAPAMATAAGLVGDLAGGFTKLNDATGGWLGKGAAIATVALGAAGGVSLVVGQVIKAKDNISKFSGALSTLKGRLSLTSTGFTILGGAVGAASLVALAATAIYADNADKKAKLRAITDEFADALQREADGQTDAVRQAIGAKVANQDLIDKAQRYGLTVKDLADIIAGKTVPAYERLRDIEPAQLWREQSGAAGDADRVFGSLDQTLQTLKTGLQNARDESALTDATMTSLGISTDKTAGAVEDKTAATDKATFSEEEYRKSIDEAVAAHQQEIDKIRESISAQREVADSTYAAAASADRYNEHLSTLKDQIKDAKGNQAEINAIYREGASLAADVADSQVRIATETATATGKTLTATQQQDQWNRVMLFAADRAGPAQRAEILNYIATANGIPAEKVTEERALIDAGKFDEADAKLAALSATRTQTVKVDIDDSEYQTLDQAVRATHVYPLKVKVAPIGPTTFTGQLVGLASASAKGTSWAPRGLGLAGEKGPEIIDFRGGERVFDAFDTRSLMASPSALANLTAGAGGPSLVVHNNRRDLTAADLNQLLAMARLAA